MVVTIEAFQISSSSRIFAFGPMRWISSTMLVGTAAGRLVLAASR